MPKFIQSALQARQSDQNTIASGVPSLVLMENAARQIAGRIAAENPRKVLFVCGPGNNGADGLAAARLLKQKNKNINIVCLFEGKSSPDEDVQITAARNAGIPILDYSHIDLIGDLDAETDIIADCLFGSGLSRPVAGKIADLILQINQTPAKVFSIDIASGLDGNTGEILGSAVKADVTLALDSIKEGQIRNDGPACSGNVEVFDILIPEQNHDCQFYVLDEELAASFLPKRSVSSHKGTYGKGLLVGGSLPMQGALAMAAKACFHAGIGTVTLYTPKEAAIALASKMDLAMIVSAPSMNGFFDLEAVVALPELLKNYSVFLAGNGMGTGKGARLVMECLMESDVKLVADADGLNCLALKKELLARKSAYIMTPHVKEFSRLSGFSVSDILRDPVACARTFIEKYPNVTLVLKGEQTIVADRTRMAWICHPNSALAKGGSGDVLAGLITGLYAQVSDPFKAACLGVYIHNQASFESLDIDPAFFTPLNLIENFNPVFLRLRRLQQ